MEFDRKPAEHPTTLAPTQLDAALAHAAELAAESIAPRTSRAYAADWGAFVAWTERQGPGVSPAFPVSVRPARLGPSRG